MDDSEKLRELTEENDRLRHENEKLKTAAALSGTKTEFSKIILVAVGFMTFAISVFACCMAWRTADTTPFSYLIPAVYTEMASATGFYYSKAKAENKIKLMALTGTEPDAQTFENM